MASMNAKMKVLNFILHSEDYCQFMRLFYSLGYTIHHSAWHPRAITIPMGVLGYVEKRDESGDTYKLVIYGKTRRGNNNARVVYLSRQPEREQDGNF